LIVIGVAALVIGGLGLLLPNIALTTTGLLFGVYLIVVGIARVSIAFGQRSLTPGWWLLSVVLGVLVVVAGVLALNNPFSSVVALTVVVGLGLIVDGAATILGGIRAPSGTPRWSPILLGVVSAIAGIVLIVARSGAAGAFVFLTSVMLVVLGVVALITAFVRGR
jgi:uncharacterized membrane protein HdeD (DUF308 family)